MCLITFKNSGEMFVVLNFYININYPFKFCLQLALYHISHFFQNKGREIQNICLICTICMKLVVKNTLLKFEIKILKRNVIILNYLCIF